MLEFMAAFFGMVVALLFSLFGVELNEKKAEDKPPPEVRRTVKAPPCEEPRAVSVARKTEASTPPPC